MLSPSVACSFGRGSGDPAVTFTHEDHGTSASRWRAHPRWPASRDFDRVRGGRSRLVVVAAHPDDETLGAGGLIASAVARRMAVELLVLTDGEGSHPNSTTWAPDALAARRRDEARAAAAALGAPVEPRLLGLPDGGLSERGELITRELVRALGDARDTVLVAPWRRDGHPDHEAAGHAAAAAAVRTGARLWEYPIWFWHWAEPQTAPWNSFVTVDVPEDARRRKAAAIEAHGSQVSPLSPASGDEALLAPNFLEHFTGPQEVFVEEATSDGTLDDLHRDDPDPWGASYRWYEQRKRDLVVAALPRRRFTRGLELGCSRGDLARDLAERCDDVVAIDRSVAALTIARQMPRANVELSVLDVPSEWPDGTFDLVVISEIGYFLSPVALDHLWARTAGSLDDHAVVVLCHWRHPVDGWVLDGPDVHARALRAALPPLMARYVDDDVEILVLAHPEDRPDPHE